MPCGLDGGDVDLLHRHHGCKGAPGLVAPSRNGVSERAWGDLPGKPPAVPAPAALTLLAAIADDRVPIAVSLFLVVCRNLERKRFAVLERRATVETETGDARNGELHRQLITFLAARKITLRCVDGDHLTIGNVAA